MTKGEYRVGIDFNPPASDMVGQIKRRAADLIDLIDSIEVGPDGPVMPGDRKGEVMRLKALAQTSVEEAVMWAVKAATKPEPK